MKDFIYTKSGNRYLYSPNTGNFILAPMEDDDTSYYEKKEAFWRENELFEEEKINLDVAYDSAYIESNLANLRQLLIEVTDGCNLSCKYCGYGELYGNYDNRIGKKQNFENVKALIDYLTELWNSVKNISFDNVVLVGFYGGEPLMNFPLIKETIDYLDTIHISGLKFEYNMTTNAVLLPRYMDYIAEKKFHLLISLDGNKENNSYRVNKSGKESFDLIVENVKLLQRKHPGYFDSHVEFNTVLHNRNSVADSYQYIKEMFNKKPSMGELSYGGIREDKREEFAKMFRAKSESIYEAASCGAIVVDDLFEMDSMTMSLSNFFEAHVGNTYRSLPDLFFDKKNITYLPTSTCPPFYKRIFLTVNGKILPCEKIGQNFPLGTVVNAKVDLNTEHIKTLYAELYDHIIKQCKNCFLWKNCGDWF